MSAIDPRRPTDPPRGPVRLLIDLYLRGLALVLILIGLGHWAVIVGDFDDPWRFESMSTAWKAVTMILAVADLVAGVGLWMRVAWGTVIWIFAAVFEIAVHTVFRETFGPAYPVVAFDVLSVAIFVALLVIERRQRRGG